MLSLRSRSSAENTGFSLIELLVVVAILVTLSTAVTPAIQALNGSGSVNKTIADLSGTLELARSWAMAHNTYVRVAFGQAAPSGPLVVLTIFSSESTTAGDMNDAGQWPPGGRPLVLSQFVMNDAMNAATPGTSADVLPSDSNMGSFTRSIPGIGDQAFDSCIQFDPSGQARVLKDEPARFIKIAIDREPRTGVNPFILRLSGANGSINILRADNGVQ